MYLKFNAYALSSFCVGTQFYDAFKWTWFCTPHTFSSLPYCVLYVRINFSVYHVCVRCTCHYLIILTSDSTFTIVCMTIHNCLCHTSLTLIPWGLKFHTSQFNPPFHFLPVRFHFKSWYLKFSWKSCNLFLILLLNVDHYDDVRTSVCRRRGGGTTPISLHS